MYKRLNVTDGLVPRSYGLPKIHKNEIRALQSDYKMVFDIISMYTNRGFSYVYYLLSPILATNIVIQDLKEYILSNIDIDIPVYYRYVDDILLAVEMYEILDKFNSYHNRLRFTVEHNYDRTVDFLDVNLRIVEGLIRFDNYKKPTNSGRYLNPNMITTKNINDLNNNNLKNYFTIPYMNRISEKFKFVADKNDFKIAYKPMNTLKSVIRLDKDRLDLMEHCNVVYRISYLDCDVSYVDRTKRKVKTRIRKYKANIKSKSSRTVVLKHQLEYGHELDWENILVLDSEPCFRKRLMSEMIFIKKQIKAINI
ncbi:hypothetical protein ALC56_01952 [Trachymyrmex septentrionalis]|uniref:Reverse transcriptase domain-containing protein n=1 Tax=Trachymyrmex septentrionalis TaxID=34720 RepID=A0A195FSX3_9HYME|nr:hypothetical protein ALC56_01952 [Trachymyrmex septentrionalis]